MVDYLLMCILVLLLYVLPRVCVVHGTEGICYYGLIFKEINV